MKSSFLNVIAVLSLFGPMAANAAPVVYDWTSSGGLCSCSGIATGVLTMAETYVPGTTTTDVNDFISFSYSSSSGSFDIPGDADLVGLNFNPAAAADWFFDFSGSDTILQSFAASGWSLQFDGIIGSESGTKSTFVLRVSDGDSDGDGVLDGDDFCADTENPEVGVPSNILLINRWALVDGDDGVFDTVIRGKGPKRSYTIDDTAGCSCEQIIAEQGLDDGQTRFGCSISVMDDWVELVSP